MYRRNPHRRVLLRRPIAGFSHRRIPISPGFLSPEEAIAALYYRRASKSGDEIRRYQAASATATQRKEDRAPFASLSGLFEINETGEHSGLSETAPTGSQAKLSTAGDFAFFTSVGLISLLLL